LKKIIGDSPALESVLAEVERVAPTDSTVLVLGETGTGKELIAARFTISARDAGRPFIKLNCAAIPFDLLESETFRAREGCLHWGCRSENWPLRNADTGTLFWMK